MPRTIRFHLDEHVAHAVADVLRILGIDATTTADAGLRGAQDAEQLAYGLAQSRVLFTEDDDFLVLAAAGHPHAGIVYCRQNSRSIGQMIGALELIWHVYEPDEISNRVEFIKEPTNKNRATGRIAGRVRCRIRFCRNSALRAPP